MTSVDVLDEIDKIIIEADLVCAFNVSQFVFFFCWLGEYNPSRLMISGDVGN